MAQQIQTNFEKKKGLINIKLIMLGIGSISSIIGLIRQWPVIGKGYIPFIEGKGYMFFTMGLIIIILGFSLQLFVLGDFNNHFDPTHQVKPEENNIET